MRHGNKQASAEGAWPGSQPFRPNSPGSTMTSTGWSRDRPCGARRKSFSLRCPASAKSSPAPLAEMPELGRLDRSRPRPLPASRHGPPVRPMARQEHDRRRKGRTARHALPRRNGRMPVQRELRAFALRCSMAARRKRSSSSPSPANSSQSSTQSSRRNTMAATKRLNSNTVAHLPCCEGCPRSAGEKTASPSGPQDGEGRVGKSGIGSEPLKHNFVQYQPLSFFLRIIRRFYPPPPNLKHNPASLKRRRRRDMNWDEIIERNRERLCSPSRRCSPSLVLTKGGARRCRGISTPSSSRFFAPPSQPCAAS